MKRIGWWLVAILAFAIALYGLRVAITRARTVPAYVGSG